MIEMNLLIVDSDLKVSTRLEAILKRSGYQVKTARHGREALDLLQDEHFDGIVSALYMPEMDGFQLCRAVKEKDNLKETPFVILTAIPDDEDTAFALDLEADLFLQISEDPQDLLSHIEKILQNPREPRRMLEEDMYLRRHAERLKKKLDNTMQEMERIRKRLSQSEIRYQKLFEGAHDAAFILDTRGVHLEANEKASALLGYTQEEFRGLSFRDIVVPSAIPDSELKLEKLLKAEDLPIYEKEFRTKDGKIIPVEISASGIRDESGDVVFIQSIVRDITERKQAEEALQRSEKQYKDLFENSPIGIYRTTPEGRILMANPAALRMLGFSSFEKLAQRDLEKEGYNAGYPRSRFKELIEREGQITGLESAWVRKDGSIVYFSENAQAVRDDSGSILYYEGTVEDITERKHAEEELKKREERFRALMRNSSDIVYVLNSEGIIQYVSPNVQQVLGYSDQIGPEEHLGVLDFVHPEDKDKAGKALTELVDILDRTLSYEFRIRDSNGSYLWVEAWGKNLLHDPAVTGIVLNIRDITERKRAEEMLKFSEEKYRTLVENLNVGVYRVTPGRDGQFVDVNQAFVKMLGYKNKEEVLKLKVSDIYCNPEDRVGFSQRVSSQGLLRNEELHLKRKNGTSFIGSDSSTTVYDADGAILCFDGILEDITERKRVEEELEKYRLHLEELVEDRTSEVVQANRRLQEEIHERRCAEESLAAEKERLSVTLRSIGDGVIATDVEGTILLINRMAEQLTGYTQEEAVEKPLDTIFNIINEETRIPCENPVRKVLKQGTVVGLGNDTVLVSKDGTERMIADSGAPIRDRNSKIIGVILVFRDITEKRRMEQELVRTQKLESIGILAGGIAHDFNNILTAILGNVNLARMYTTEGKVDEKLAKIEKASIQAKDLTQQLLTFSKGGAPIKKTTTIGELIRDSTSFALRGSNVKCHFSIPDELWPADIDEGQIGQVINNLIINAYQAMPGGGTIEVQAENAVIIPEEGHPLQQGRYLKLSITDQGIGIPEKYLPKIFDPYFTTKQKGSGLGLATTYSIIKRHNGYIDVESRVGAGTTFTLWLPASHELSEEEEKKTDEMVRGEGKILLMDDEEIILDAAGEVLRVLGYTVKCAKDGREAIELYRKAKEAGTPFDAVIMDLTIPGGMGGKEAISNLLGIDPGVKAIVSSGYSTDPVMADFGKYGFKGVVTKPYSIEELSEILHRVIKSS